MGRLNFKPLGKRPASRPEQMFKNELAFRTQVEFLLNRGVPVHLREKALVELAAIFLHNYGNRLGGAMLSAGLDEMAPGVGQAALSWLQCGATLGTLDSYLDRQGVPETVEDAFARNSLPLRMF